MVSAGLAIQPGAAIAIIVLDNVINIALTIIFVWQLRPTINSIAHRSPRHTASKVESKSKEVIVWSLRWRNDTARVKNSSSRNNLRVMLVRNVVGSSLLLVITVANNAIFLKWSFAKMSHTCLLMCLTDGKRLFTLKCVQQMLRSVIVVVGMLITNWLTMRSAEEETDSNGPSVTPVTSNSGASGLTSLPSRRTTVVSNDHDMNLDTPIGENARPINNTNFDQENGDINFNVH